MWFQYMPTLFKKKRVSALFDLMFTFFNELLWWNSLKDNFGVRYYNHVTNPINILCEIYQTRSIITIIILMCSPVSNSFFSTNYFLIHICYFSNSFIFLMPMIYCSKQAKNDQSMFFIFIVTFLMGEFCTHREVTTILPMHTL